MIKSFKVSLCYRDREFQGKPVLQRQSLLKALGRGRGRGRRRRGKSGKKGRRGLTVQTQKHSNTEYSQ